MNQSFNKDGAQFASCFIEKVENLLHKAKTEGECIVCHLKPNAKGYCYVTVGRDFRFRAHRLVYEIKNGPIPRDKIVMHTCDNRACINPAHLKLGSNYENTQDMIRKDRCARLGRPPINEETLKETVRMKDAGFTLQQIADKQRLSGPSSVRDRLRRAKNVGI